MEIKKVINIFDSILKNLEYSRFMDNSYDIYFSTGIELKHE